MGWFSKDAATSERVDEALEAQDQRDAAVGAARDKQAADYVKQHGLEKVVEKMTDDAMDRFRPGWR